MCYYCFTFLFSFFFLKKVLVKKIRVETKVGKLEKKYEWMNEMREYLNEQKMNERQEVKKKDMYWCARENGQKTWRTTEEEEKNQTLKKNQRGKI